MLFAARVPFAGVLTGPIHDAGLRAELEDAFQLPATGSPQLTRINVLREAPDGSGRLFVNDLRGPLHLVDGPVISTYLDLSALRGDFIDSPGLAMGFVSFAFHPDFAANGVFYTVHTESVGATPPTHGPAEPTGISHHSILSEWTASDPSASAFAGTAREILRIAAPERYHNLGEIAFDPGVGPGQAEYGLLYLAAGDYGAMSVGEPGQLQRLDTLLGALLRIDPRGGDGSAYSYAIPPGNPYASDGDPNTLGEIYAHGFRNGHRIAFGLGALGGPFVSDIGQGNVEEVNLLVAGANYGWPEREGSFALDDADSEVVVELPEDDASFGYHYPVAQYDHDEGRAIAGGFILENDPTSFLYAKFVFGDIVSGRILYADTAALLAADDADPATTAPIFELTLLREGSETTLLERVREETGRPTLGRVDLRFGMDAAGQLYVMTKQDGYVRRLVAQGRGSIPALPGAAGVLLVALTLLSLRLVLPAPGGRA